MTTATESREAAPFEFKPIEVDVDAASPVVGLIISTMGVASTFFAGLTSYCWGFAALAAICAYNIHLYQKHLPHSTLEKTADVFEQIELDLESTAGDLAAENKKLKETNCALRERVSELTTLIAELRDCCRRIQREVKDFAANNCALGKTRANLDQSIERLDERIKTADTFYERTVEFITRDRKDLADKIRAMTAYWDQIGDKNAWATRMRSLEEQIERFRVENDRLTQTRKDFESERIQLAGVRGDITKLVRRE